MRDKPIGTQQVRWQRRHQCGSFTSFRQGTELLGTPHPSQEVCTLVDLAGEAGKARCPPVGRGPDAELAQQVRNHGTSHATGKAHIGDGCPQVTLHHHFRRLLPWELEPASDRNRSPYAQGLGMSFSFNIIRNLKRDGRVFHYLDSVACDPHDNEARPSSRTTRRSRAIELPQDKRLITS